MAILDKLFGDDVNPDNIHETAKIEGTCRITGARTRIGPGAVVRNSFLTDTIVEEGSTVEDSMLISEGEIPPQEDKNPFMMRWIFNMDHITVGKNSVVRNSTAHNFPMGEGCSIIDSTIWNGNMGSHCRVEGAYCGATCLGDHSTVIGPTETCGVWLGHHGTIAQPGYYEGILSNDLYVLEYDKAAGKLNIAETLDVPHLTKYGLNCIMSSNSGRVREQEDGYLRTLGERKANWQGHLLSHEPVMVGPMAWISGWTKLIGKSDEVCESAEGMLTNPLSTYVMPFSVSGTEGAAAMAQVMTGELNNGYAYKQRTPGWVFTYAPGAVIAMVKEIVETTGDSALADRIVELNLKNALAMIYSTAGQRGTDLDGGKVKTKGWGGWMFRGKDIMEAHLASGLWEFNGGEPTQWTEKDGKWIPKDESKLLAIAEDALENQQSEDEFMGCEQEPVKHPIGIDLARLKPTQKPITIADEAQVADSASIAGGTQILGKSIVEDGAIVNQCVIKDSRIGKDTEIQRCAVEDSDIGARGAIISTSIDKTTIGDDALIRAGRMENVKAPEQCFYTPGFSLKNVKIKFPGRVGSNTMDSVIDTFHMSCHLAGHVQHMVSNPSISEVDGKEELIFATPMLGGGCRLMGEADNKINIECSFIGSNAQIAAGAYVGFGSFVLGKLTSEEGLLPLSASTQAGPERDGIGAVAEQMGSIIITHYLEWGFQCNGIERADLMGALVPTQLRRGIAAIKWAQGLRESGQDWDESSPYAVYKSLKLYTDEQLEVGLKTYESQLIDDRWLLKYTDGELRFAGNGAWKIVDGAARWESAG